MDSSSDVLSSSGDQSLEQAVKQLSDKDRDDLTQFLGNEQQKAKVQNSEWPVSFFFPNPICGLVWDSDGACSRLLVYARSVSRKITLCASLLSTNDIEPGYSSPQTLDFPPPLLYVS